MLDQRRLIGTIIQSVPARRELRERLLAQLPDALVVEDDGPPPPNPWRGYQLCLDAVRTAEWTHGVIVQDDAVVCENFAEVVDRIANVFPTQPVCLFYPGLKMRSWRFQRDAQRKGRTFFPLSAQDFLPVVGVLWPQKMAESLLEWSQDRDIPGLRAPYLSDDAVAGSWMRHTKTQVYVAMPSIVQHPDDTEPVKGGHHVARHGADRGRVAASFVDGDPLAIDWKS